MDLSQLCLCSDPVTTSYVYSYPDPAQKPNRIHQKGLDLFRSGSGYIALRKRQLESVKKKQEVKGQENVKIKGLVHTITDPLYFIL